MQNQLYDTADQYADSQGGNGNLQKTAQQERRQDHGDIQEDGRNSRGEEMAQCIEDAHAECHQADEEDVGEHYPVEQNGQFELARHGTEAGEHQANDPGGEKDAGQGDSSHDNCQQGEAGISQLAGIIFAPLGQRPGKGRYKSRCQRPFGKKTAQHIGDLESSDKSVAGQAGPEQARDNHIPHHTHHAGQHGGAAQNSGSPDYVAFFRHVTSRSCS